MRLALLLVPAILLATPAAEAQRGVDDRCGWVVSTGPGNWWLLDRHTRTNTGWLISARGGFAAAGRSNIPEDFTKHDWSAARGGDGGYGCACMQVRTDVRNRRITRIYKVEQQPLAQCRANRRLPKPL